MNGWRSVPLRAIYQRVELRGRADMPLLSVYRDHGVVPRDERDDNNNRPSDDLSTYKYVRPGDLVVNKMKTWQGSLAVSGHEGIVSPAYFVGRRVTDVDDRFMHHLLRSMPLIAEYGARSKGIRPSQWDLPWDEFAAIKVSLPSAGEQRAIADYLDTETARIDALITKKQRMIEVLDERFRAEGRQLITGGSPTGGWSPGAAWAGPVPLDWSAYKIASFARLGSGTTPASDVAGYYSDEGTAWVTTAELREREITTTARCVTDLALRDCSALKVFPPGAVLVAMYGATVGRVGILGMPAATNQACCAIYGASPRLDLKFVYWWLILNRQHLLDMAYGAGQPNISQETIRSLRVPAPGVDDQQSIAAKLDHLHARTAECRAVLERQINLLSEHRQALITAAVTGELEIPGVAA